MVLTDRAEEIMESLWVELIEKEKETCDAAILRDDESLRELSEAGHVRIKDNLIKLTRKGKEEAKSCIRRHRLAERLFTDILDLKGKSVHETSCKFEHLLHKGLDENVCTLLGHPKTCPHGRPIPEGECCRKMKKTPSKLIMPLSELGKKKKAKVAYLHTEDREALKKMIAMGLLPNTKIELIQKFPSYVFQSGRSQFAIDKELAGNVFVRLV